jgi:hypothetical protein
VRLGHEYGLDVLGRHRGEQRQRRLALGDALEVHLGEAVDSRRRGVVPVARVAARRLDEDDGTSVVHGHHVFHHNAAVLEELGEAVLADAPLSKLVEQPVDGPVALLLLYVRGLPFTSQGCSGSVGIVDG